jgi:hypothetical protein
VLSMIPYIYRCDEKRRKDTRIGRYRSTTRSSLVLTPGRTIDAHAANRCRPRLLPPELFSRWYPGLLPARRRRGGRRQPGRGGLDSQHDRYDTTTATPCGAQLRVAMGQRGWHPRGLVERRSRQIARRRSVCSFARTTAA